MNVVGVVLLDMTEARNTSDVNNLLVVVELNAPFIFEYLFRYLFRFIFRNR